MNVTFNKICVQIGRACGITTFGTLQCWNNTNQGSSCHPDAHNHPSTIDLLYNDYYDITCNDDATCALRGNGAMTCWFATGKEEASIIIPSIADDVSWSYLHGYLDLMYGILSNGTLYQLNPKHSAAGIFNATLRYKMVHQSFYRHCYISFDTNVPWCSSYGNGLDILSIGRFDITMSTSNYLRAVSTGVVAIIPQDGSVMYSGDYQRLRVGGDAMSPRSTLKRIVHIAPASDGGVDAPFCGQRYFKPCASVAYAQSLTESFGAYVIFQLGAGRYELARPISIDYNGIEIRGSTNPNDPSVFVCDICLQVNAPAFTLSHIHIYRGGFSRSATTIITINNAFDIIFQSVIIRSVPRGPSSILLLLAAATFIDTHIFCAGGKDITSTSNGVARHLVSSNLSFFFVFLWQSINIGSQATAAIVVTSSSLTLVDSYMTSCYSASTAGGILATTSDILINGCRFEQCFSGSWVRICFSLTSHTFIHSLRSFARC
jgi:hypothetical protein